MLEGKNAHLKKKTHNRREEVSSVKNWCGFWTRQRFCTKRFEQVHGVMVETDKKIEQQFEELENAVEQAKHAQEFAKSAAEELWV